ncbi:hypothetical protein MHBO_000404 [Bonamia ostreae]|uniref:mRNA cap-binding protein n=1 Tax=Bonamia ostreae TaxID=126728 RepID=A0ABV2AG57_9EUKA
MDSKKLQLKCNWRLFYTKTKAQRQNLNQFISHLEKIADIETVEDLYKHYIHLKRPSELVSKDNYMFFRDGLIPAWENFPNGGCWIIKVSKNNGLIDRIWEEIIFAAACEKFLDLDMIGIMVSIRGREDKISIWNRGSKVLNNGERLRKILNLDPETHLQYQSFSHAVEVGATYRDAISFVYKPFFYKSSGVDNKIEHKLGKKDDLVGASSKGDAGEATV